MEIAVTTWEVWFTSTDDGKVQALADSNFMFAFFLNVWLLLEALLRLLYDDGKGVAEALNETVCVDSREFYITIDPLGQGAKCAGHMVKRYILRFFWPSLKR
ncbi:hypothetical protein E3N88_32745 [Mikania micrantha]|uniref:Uncharacterized protein n=1 Tax=Mikania micrantha TaxID=192012 RepID=A0A5N6M990_9ASTR|nr:hypothetical protein E3N88_32745 [Mikania micrantha]